MASADRTLGHGIGLRTRHYGRLLAEPVPVDFLEVITENFLVPGGRPLAVLEKVRRDVPVAFHGVSLSIGSTDPLSETYLAGLRALIDRIEPAIVSDHLSFGSHRGHHGHDLWPLPRTAETIAHVVPRIARVEEALGRRLLLENPSSYVSYREDEMPEWELLAEIARRADCGILLDVNNVVVSAHNHGFDPIAYLDGIPTQRVGQIHLAGHSDKGRYLLDTHVGPTPEVVWSLYREAVRRLGRVPSLIEWDEGVPELEVVVAESEKARAIEAEELSRRAA